MSKLEETFNKGHTYRQWIFSLLANCTLLAYGMECGWISPTTKILQSAESPTGKFVSDSTLSWIASSMSLSAIFGVSIYTFITDTYGRKLGVILIAIPQIISWIIRLCYSSTAGLILARVLAGISAGGCFNVIPMYIKEISQDDIRGVLGTFVVLLQTVGLLIMYIIGAYLSYYTVILIAVILPVIVSILFVKAPESPAFLVKQGKYNEATETIAYLRGLDKDDKIVQNLVECMKNEEVYFKSLPNITFASILKEKSWRRGLLIIMATFVFHALNGAYAIITYASTILISTGVKFKISPEIQTFSFPIFMIVGSLSLATCVEKCGRKPLLVAAFLITGCSMAVIAVLMILQDKGWSIPSWLPVIAIILAVSMYGAGVSPLPYIIMTEMFSFQLFIIFLLNIDVYETIKRYPTEFVMWFYSDQNAFETFVALILSWRVFLQKGLPLNLTPQSDIRAKVMGIVVTFAWTLTAVLVTMYTPLSTYIGPYAPFVFYAIINFLGTIFTLLYIPETKAKTEEEITQILSNRKKNIDNEET